MKEFRTKARCQSSTALNMETSISMILPYSSPISDATKRLKWDTVTLTVPLFKGTYFNHEQWGKGMVYSTVFIYSNIEVIIFSTNAGHSSFCVKRG